MASRSGLSEEYLARIRRTLLDGVITLGMFRFMSFLDDVSEESIMQDLADNPSPIGLCGNCRAWTEGRRDGDKVLCVLCGKAHEDVGA